MDGLGGVAQEGDEDALDDEFVGGDKVREVGVFSLKVGFSFVGDVAFECGFAIDEGGDDFVVSWLASFEDDGIAVTDVGVDHGIAADAEGEGFSFSGDAEGLDIDGEAAFLLLLGVFRKAGGDLAVDGDVADFLTIEFFGEDDGACFAGKAEDGAFFFEGAEVTHGGSLAGEAEVVLYFPG